MDNLQYIEPDDLFYGNRCKQAHAGHNHYNLRLKKGHKCLACALGLPEGPYSLMFNMPEPEIKRYDKEEQRLRHIQVVMEWNSRNQDKTKVYGKKYMSTDEYKEKIKTKNKTLTDEQKAKRSERNKVAYLKRKLKNEPIAL
jgi:hypothetical protein